VASTPTEAAPAPLGGERLALVPGVLGAIARERATDLAGAAADVPVRAGAAARRGRLRAALARPGLALLAEVKRASPSQGLIADIDPVAAGRAYAAGGAAALSVLTEPRHFAGERAHLRAVAAAVDLPLLRKDFVVHPAQLVEAADDGAAGVLLIAAVLGDALGAYLRATWSLGLDALVEVHDEAELDLARAAGADLIGVNNRDLRTLAIDTSTAPRLIARGRALGHQAVWVAESGYASGAEARALIGVADAVLVGTSLAGSGDLEGATRAFLDATTDAGAPRRALVTGASSGIGAACAAALAQAGWSLVLQGRDAERTEEVASRARALGAEAVTCLADLAADDDVARLAATSLERPLHALVHAAGLIELGRVADVGTAVLDAHYAVNVRAPYALTRALLPALRDARGHVVFVNSGAGRQAKAQWSAYAASKFALRALADALREEEDALRVTTVYPGRTATPMQAAVRAAEGAAYAPETFVQPEAVAAQIVALLELPRPSLVSELVIRPG